MPMGLGLRQYAVFIGLAILLAAAFFAFRYREDPAGERPPANAAAGEESANRPGGGAGGSGAGEKAANAAAAAARNRDPIEVKNLAFLPEMQPMMAQLLGRLRAWQQRTGDEVNLPDPPYRR